MPEPYVPTEPGYYWTSLSEAADSGTTHLVHFSAGAKVRFFGDMTARSLDWISERGLVFHPGPLIPPTKEKADE